VACEHVELAGEESLLLVCVRDGVDALHEAHVVIARARGTDDVDGAADHDATLLRFQRSGRGLRRARRSRMTEPLRYHVAELEGGAGRVRLDIGKTPYAMVEVHDGEVEIHEGAGDADAVATCDSEAMVSALGRGELNPVVAALQNKLALDGDLVLAIRVILGVHGVARAL